MAEQANPEESGARSAAEASPALLTPFGVAVQRGERGELPLEGVLAAFLESDLWLPRVVDPSEGSVQPVVASHRPGETLVAAFDSAESAREVANLASFAVPISARDLLSGLTEELGLSIGTATSRFITDAETCRRMRTADAP